MPDTKNRERGESLIVVEHLANNGFHVVPMRGKRPLPGVEWRHATPPTMKDIRRYWSAQNAPGTAIVCKSRTDTLYIGALDLEDQDAAGATWRSQDHGAM